MKKAELVVSCLLDEIFEVNSPSKYNNPSSPLEIDYYDNDELHELKLVLMISIAHR